MHWFGYVWIFMLIVTMLIWGFFSIRDIIDTIRNVEGNPLYAFRCFEEYTQAFIFITLMALFSYSFVKFLIDITAK